MRYTAWLPLPVMLGTVFVVVKFAGCAYLIWLGYKMWTREPAEFLQQAKQSTGFVNTFLAGLLITLSNPKVIFFYLGFLPAFMDLSRLRGTDIVVVTLLVITVLVAVTAGYAYSAARARRFFSGRKAALALNRGAGSVMIATGLVIAARQ